jgi:hypothetical protein
LSEIVLRLPQLHKSQLEVVRDKARFNALNCGRRWGKTVLGIDLAIETALDGGKIGYFLPTYKFVSPVWREFKDLTHDLIKQKDEQQKAIDLITNGHIDFWSLDNPIAGRGREYDRVIVDEAAYVKDLEESWNRSIRATLVKTRGDAWFLSTPNGVLNYFYEICETAKNRAEWSYFHYPSSTNPHLPSEELEQTKGQLDNLTWLQEYEAEFVNFTGRPFAYAFDKDKHVKEVEYNPDLFIYLSFDFNVDPATCAVFQLGDNSIRMIDEFHLPTSSIYDLCDAIKAKYPGPYMVTGDASGWSREKATAGLTNMYEIIKNCLHISYNVIHTPKSNGLIRDSRVIMNTIFERYPEVIISPKCVHTIKSLMLCDVDQFGDIPKESEHLKHHLDTVRYLFNTFFVKFVKI